MLATADTRTVQALITAIDIPIAVIALAAGEATWLVVNSMFAALAGAPAAKLRGRAVAAGLEPSQAAAVQIEIELARTAGGPLCLVHPACLRQPGGGWRATLRPLRDRDGRVRRLLLVGLDATERVRADNRLRESEERYRALVQMSPDAVTILEHDRIVFCNPAGARLAGVADASHLVGRSVLDLAHSDDRERMAGRLREIAEGDTHLAPSEWRIVRSDGQPITVETVASRIVWQGRPALQVCSRDISGRKAALLRIEHLALHDHLTGIGNRAQFESELERSCTRARRAGASVAVLFIDLDRFKEVNDRLGHAAGDELLRQVAARLVANLRGSDLVARLGGDEFAIVAADQPAGEGFRRLTRRLELLFAEPFMVADQTVTIGASIGVALFPRHTDRPERLLALADRAMYRGKQAGRQQPGWGEPGRAVTTVAAVEP